MQSFSDFQIEILDFYHPSVSIFVSYLCTRTRTLICYTKQWRCAISQRIPAFSTILLHLYDLQYYDKGERARERMTSKGMREK